MSADLFAAFITDSADGSSIPSNVAGQRQTVALGSWNNTVAPSVPTAQFGSTHSLQRDSPATPLWQTDSQGADILFDAETAHDDDFGDFEDVKVDSKVNEAPRSDVESETSKYLPPRSSNQSTTELISLEPVLCAPVRGSSISNSPKKQEVLNADFPPELASGDLEAGWDDDWGNFEQTRPEDKSPARSGRLEITEQSSTITPAPVDETEDDWEPFEDGQPQQPQSQTATAPQSLAASASGNMITPVSTQTAERPTNVPPPAMLLQLLSSVFGVIHDLNNTGQESKQVLAARVLVIFRSISRIIAGRTLRWKRDTILAQSMRIGHAGGTGGMKLTSVNKGESAKEEREVEGLIGHWSGYAHEFNSILAQASLTGSRLKITSSPSLKTLKGAGISKQCALCGLYRSERVNGVDTDMDDLFGEFWTEHWGHKDCCEFWVLYKEHLSQR